MVRVGQGLIARLPPLLLRLLCLQRWAAAPSPEGGDLDLAAGRWERYRGNAEAAIAALLPLTRRGAVVTAADRVSAIRGALEAWQLGVPPAGMDDLQPLLLWALARAHVRTPGAPLRLAAHCAFVMRFSLDEVAAGPLGAAAAFARPDSEGWCELQLITALLAARAQAGLAPETWRYYHSSPGRVHVEPPQPPGGAGGNAVAGRLQSYE